MKPYSMPETVAKTASLQPGESFVTSVGGMIQPWGSKVDALLLGAGGEELNKPPNCIPHYCRNITWIKQSLLYADC